MARESQKLRFGALILGALLLAGGVLSAQSAKAAFAAAREKFAARAADTSAKNLPNLERMLPAFGAIDYGSDDKTRRACEKFLLNQVKTFSDDKSYLLRKKALQVLGAVLGTKAGVEDLLHYGGKRGRKKSMRLSWAAEALSLVDRPLPLRELLQRGLTSKEANKRQLTLRALGMLRTDSARKLCEHHSEVLLALLADQDVNVARRRSKSSRQLTSESLRRHEIWRLASGFPSTRGYGLGPGTTFGSAS